MKIALSQIHTRIIYKFHVFRIDFWRTLRKRMVTTEFGHATRRTGREFSCKMFNFPTWTLGHSKTARLRTTLVTRNILKKFNCPAPTEPTPHSAHWASRHCLQRECGNSAHGKKNSNAHRNAGVFPVLGNFFSRELSRGSATSCARFLALRVLYLAEVKITKHVYGCGFVVRTL